MKHAYNDLVVVQIGSDAGWLGSVTVGSLIEATDDLPVDQIVGFLKGRMTIVRDDEPEITLSDSHDDWPRQVILSFLKERESKQPPSTPLTRENLLKWAENKALQEPQRPERRWNNEQSCFEDFSTPNTPALVIADLLLEVLIRTMDGSDAKDTVRELYYNGNRGYKDYTFEEALNELEDSWENLELEDLEELLETYYD